jgi:hypothetical protein
MEEEGPSYLTSEMEMRASLMLAAATAAFIAAECASGARVCEKSAIAAMEKEVEEIISIWKEKNQNES